MRHLPFVMKICLRVRNPARIHHRCVFRLACTSYGVRPLPISLFPGLHKGFAKEVLRQETSRVNTYQELRSNLLTLLQYWSGYTHGLLLQFCSHYIYWQRNLFTVKFTPLLGSQRLE